MHALRVSKRRFANFVEYNKNAINSNEITWRGHGKNIISVNRQAMTSWRFVKAPCQLADTPDADDGICSACCGVAFSHQVSPCIHHQYCDHLSPCAVPFSNHRPYVFSYRRVPSPISAPTMSSRKVDSLHFPCMTLLWKK